MAYSKLLAWAAYIGTITAHALAIVTLYTFAVAYTHNYRVLVDINRYGEAHAELAMLAILVPVMVVGLPVAMRRLVPE